MDRGDETMSLSMILGHASMFSKPGGWLLFPQPDRPSGGGGEGTVVYLNERFV